jgi:predicted RNA-binding protein with PUA-like domain
VQVKFVEKFATFVSLESLRGQKELGDMVVLRKGSRLSIQPVTEKECSVVCKMGRKA